MSALCIRLLAAIGLQRTQWTSNKHVSLEQTHWPGNISASSKYAGLQHKHGLSANQLAIRKHIGLQQTHWLPARFQQTHRLRANTWAFSKTYWPFANTLASSKPIGFRQTHWASANTKISSKRIGLMQTHGPSANQLAFRKHIGLQQTH